MKRLSLLIAFALGLILVLASGHWQQGLTHLPLWETAKQSVPLVKLYQPLQTVGASPTPPAIPSELRVAPIASEKQPNVGQPSHTEPLQPAAAIKPASSKIVARQAGQDSFRPFEQVVKGAERLNGLFTLYRDASAGKLYAEIQPHQLNTSYLCTVTLESGIGENGIYSGLPLADFLFTFRRVNNQIQFSIPNVYFRTQPGDPLQRSVQRSFSNSVLQALPIRSIHPQRKSVLVELGSLFLSDLPGLSPFLSVILGSNYSLDGSKSYFGPAKAFPLNVEIESVYGFSGSGSSNGFPAFVTTLPDSRTFNLRVRYSLSQLPANNGYRPRLADDRVGYFITAYQDFSDDSPRTPFVRYINRWNLEKQSPKAALSPPKKPIVFWIENTVPTEYRQAVRDGVLMWNSAFEKAGFKDAIQVRQMPDNAAWDPADVRYNTIRWLSSFDSGFLGLGPSRVNPMTGEILDADILIDASFSRYLKQQYRGLTQQNRMQLMPSLAKLTGNPNLCSYGMDSHYIKQTVSPSLPVNPRLSFQLMSNYDLCYGLEASQQLAIGSTALSMLHNALPSSVEMKQYVQEFLRMLVAHEVGHTLGLRHNFRGSAMLSPDELNNPEVTRKKGLVGSVMDYSAVNLAPQGVKQGDYFTHRIGPYDEWAIAYGYSPSAALVPQAETRFLEAIARRAPAPELAYATDEDTFADLDPQAHPFDLSNDLLTYAPQQFDNALQMWQRLDRRYPLSGESFSDVRLIFDEIFNYYFQFSRLLTTYVGGQSFNRYRAGDAAGRLPFEPISADKQRQALDLLQRYVFDEGKFRFSPGFLNKLAPSRWSHWGEDPELFSLDYPIHDRILRLQSIILKRLLDYDRLARLRDAELKTHSQAVLTIPELFNSLQTAIWREVLQPSGPLKLSSLRRGLQREHLAILSRMVLRKAEVPEDARSIAWYTLKQLRGSLDTTLRRRGGDMDTYTKAHLEETRDRITKTLDAQLQAQ